MTPAPLYTSPPLTVGKHEWRILVTETPITGTRCTRYEWRRIGEQGWQLSTRWPGYNPNDTYNGLPMSLRILWEREQQNVARAMGWTVEPVRQGRLI